MDFNPSPKIADCRDIARKWGNKQQVIIIAIDRDGNLEAATYGDTVQACKCAKVLGDVAVGGIKTFVGLVEQTEKGKI